MKDAARTWRRTEAWPVLPEGCVQVWRTSLVELERQAPRFAGMLAAEERERASRFRTAQLRARYEATRGALRRLVSHYTGVPPQRVPFAYNAHGKPELPPGCAERPLFFNLSHSGDLVVFGFTRLAPLGVDVEMIRRDMPRREEIARRYFSADEVAQIEALPAAERIDAFFHCWTRKEAFVKARGDGIFAGLQSFTVTAGAPAEARLLRSADDPEAAARWWLARLPDIDGYAGAVALHAPHADLQCWEAEAGFILA